MVRNSVELAGLQWRGRYTALLKFELWCFKNYKNVSSVSIVKLSRKWKKLFFHTLYKVCKMCSFEHRLIYYQETVSRGLWEGLKNSFFVYVCERERQLRWSPGWRIKFRKRPLQNLKPGCLKGFLSLCVCLCDMLDPNQSQPRPLWRHQEGSAREVTSMREECQ